MIPDENFDDLRDSIDVLQQFEGVKVHGFRAPSFSIVPGTEWVFDVIAKSGLEYDASLFSVDTRTVDIPVNPRHFLFVVTSQRKSPNFP